MDLLASLSVNLDVVLARDTRFLDPTMASSCDCGPPPTFNVPPPPDPSTFMDFDPETMAKMKELSEQCEADFPVVSLDLNPGKMDPIFSEYLAFLVSAVVVMVFVALTAVFVLLWFQRLGKRKEKMGQNRPLKSASSSTGLSSGTGDDLAPSTSRSAINKTQWSYNSMLPSTHNNSKERDLGVMMYGGSADQLGIAPSGVPYQTNMMSSRTMPVPPSMGVSTRLHPANLHIDDRIYCSATPVHFKPATYDNRNVYEEIRVPPRTVSCGTGVSETVFENPESGRKRLPPPRVQPPPPPSDSPSSSCQSSPGSNSLDQELEYLHTPSPKRKTEQPAHHKSTQSDDSFLDSSGQSPEEFCTDCANGRESGYGTEGRANRLWDSPKVPKRGDKGMIPKTNPKHNPKHMWVTAKEQGQGRKGSNGALAVYTPPSTQTTMTYV